MSITRRRQRNQDPKMKKKKMDQDNPMDKKKKMSLVADQHVR